MTNFLSNVIPSIRPGASSMVLRAVLVFPFLALASSPGAGQGALQPYVETLPGSAVKVRTWPK